jgi:hypothetical protein
VEIHRRKRSLDDRDDHHPSAEHEARQNALPVVLADYLARQAGEMARVQAYGPVSPGERSRRTGPSGRDISRYRISSRPHGSVRKARGGPLGQ